MINQKKIQAGFTLMEILLVMVIISVIVVMGVNYTTQKTDELRRDRAALQYQQILNAGLAYYVNNGAWPTDIHALRFGYLPYMAIYNPWGNAYEVTTSDNIFYVYSKVPSGTAALLSQANILAGRLPIAFATTDNNPPSTSSVCTPLSTTCYVASGVTIPGQNLNNARSVNFANLYRNGGCVPAPVCPGNMTPEIMAIPVSVSGLNDQYSSYVYAIHSFTAYAYGAYRGGGGISPTSTPADYSLIANCDNTAALACESTGGTSAGLSGNYWRVCLKIITSKGDVSKTNPTEWGAYQTILAITRCAPSGEPTGSDFTVFTS